MAQKPIHINTSAENPGNIKAEDDAAWMSAIIGTDANSTSAILPFGDRMASTKINNNEIRIGSGIYAMQGFIINIPTAENFNISNGEQGKNRIDTVVAEYQKNTPNDRYEIKILQGTATTGTPNPRTLTVQDLHNGGSLRQEEIGRVYINNTEIINVMITAPIIQGLGKLGVDISTLQTEVNNIGKVYIEARNLISGFEVTKWSDGVMEARKTASTSFNFASVWGDNDRIYGATKTIENISNLGFISTGFEEPIVNIRETITWVTGCDVANNNVEVQLAKFLHNGWQTIHYTLILRGRWK